MGYSGEFRCSFDSVCGLSVRVASLSIAAGTFSCNGSSVELSADASAAALRTVADCPAGTNTIEGTDLDDRLIGTGADDCILGHDGDDVIRGRGGDDYLAGGRGSDDIRGNRGNDRIYGEQGDDEIFGGDGDDTIRGGGGDDIIDGDDGNDDLRGNGGADVIRGGPGSDQLDGGPGDDTLRGGGGPDLIIGGPGTDVISGGSGDTVIDEVGDAAVDLELNSWPIVESIVPVPSRIDTGETTMLTTQVSDPDGDALGFLWSATCDGMFNDAAAAEPSFTLTVADDVLCTLSVDISDERGGRATGSITIATGAATPTDEGQTP